MQLLDLSQRVIAAPLPSPRSRCSTKGLNAMSFSTPMPIPSGMSLPVLAVEGRTPQTQEDFAGEVSFLLDLDPPHLVQGCGVVDGSTVRFYEKDVDNNGKDIRVWTVCSRGTRFVAEHVAQF